MNLLEEYATFADLERARRSFCDEVSGRTRLATGRVPLDMLAEERSLLHVLPERPVAFGQT